MQPPIFHVGFPKTGTTWLQKEYFPTIQNVKYFGRDHVNGFFLKDDAFDVNPEKLAEYYRNEGYDRYLFSSERLIGPLFLGYRDGAVIKYHADRIKQVFPDAEIIIFIRNQVNLIASLYMQYVRNGGNFPVKKFLYTDDQALFSFRYLEFHKSVGYYKQLFNNVHVFCFEEFAANPKDFISRFENTFGFTSSLDSSAYAKRVNPSIRLSLLPFFKFLNLFLDGYGGAKYQICSIPGLRSLKNKLYHSAYKSKFAVKPSKPAKILGAKNVQFIESYYRESNSRLINEHNLHLIKDFGYPL